MKNTMLTLLAMAGVLLLSSCTGKKQDTQQKAEATAAQPQAEPVQYKKYDTKSGIVTYDVAFDFGALKVKSKKVLYFDDYGMKECEDTYDENGLKESYYSDGKNLYTAIHEKKSVFKRGIASRGTAYKFDWDEIPSKDKESGRAKQIPHMTVAGKECEAFELNDPEHNTHSKFAGWNHICLFTEVRATGTTTMFRAVKVEENVSVPAEKFTTPAGYDLKESQF